MVNDFVRIGCKMIRFGLVLLCLTSVLGLGYEGFKIYDVTTSSQDQRDILHELSKQDDYDFFMLPRIANKPSRVMVPPEKQEEFTQILVENKMQFEVINANVARTVEEQFLQNKLARSSASRGFSTKRYYSHDEINAYIEKLAETFPNRASVQIVGRTYEKRLMKTITITNGDGRANKKIILVVGGIHAREWLAPATALYLVEQLVENFKENEELLLDYDWIVLPVVNADGYEYTQKSASSRYWRKTRAPYETATGAICTGTNIDGNFDFHWMDMGASSNPCMESYAGPFPSSEPETQAVRDLLFSIQDRCKFYLSLHSYGNFLIYPWGWTFDLPDSWKDLNEVAVAGSNAILEATGTVYEVGSTTNVLYGSSGSSDDYAFGVLNIPISITMELPGGGYTGFDPPPASIDSKVKESWIGIRAMAVTVVNKY